MAMRTPKKKKKAGHNFHRLTRSWYKKSLHKRLKQNSLSKVSRYIRSSFRKHDGISKWGVGGETQWTTDSINSLPSPPRPERKCHVYCVLSSLVYAFLCVLFCSGRRKQAELPSSCIMSHGVWEGIISYQLFNAITVHCSWRSVWSFQVRWAHSTLSAWFFPKAEPCSVCSKACGCFWKKCANVGNSWGIFYNLSSSAVTHEACQGHLISLCLC